MFQKPKKKWKQSSAIQKWLAVFLAVLLVLPLFLYMENNMLTTTKIPVYSSEIPDSFHGYRIVHLSDLHSKSFGENQQRLTRKVADLKPDIIVFTGDLIDLRRGSVQSGIILMKNLTAIAPVYFVTGNQEWEEEVETLEQQIRDAGVYVLKNESVTLVKGGNEVTLLGIDDPLFLGTWRALYQALGTVEKPGLFTMLLSHRPEIFSIYAEAGMDLTFTGHAHGGQIRIPFVGGLFAPGQGFFPKYTAGSHTMGSSTMVINRGLGNSLAPQRIFNRPEIILVELFQK